MFESLFRRSCSECGGPIVWLDLAEAQKDPELTKLVREAAVQLGAPVVSIWRCTHFACRETGFFGPLHMAG
jgi:hypothetical protein